jgi:hypothetical protein
VVLLNSLNAFIRIILSAALFSCSIQPYMLDRLHCGEGFLSDSLGRCHCLSYVEKSPLEGQCRPLDVSQ